MLPPESTGTTVPVPLELAVQERGDADRARPFDDELRALENEHERLADLLVRHGHHVVEHVREDRHRQLAGLLDRDAVRDRVARSAGQRARRLHAHDAQPRLHRAERERDAGGEAAAADRDQHRLDVGHLLCELEADRPLARDDERLLERMNERRTVLRDVLARRVEARLDRVAGEHDLGAVVPCCLDLRHRRVLRHEHARARADLARRPRDRLSVVACARGDDSGSAFLLAQQRDAVVRAADLERARALQVLGLEMDLAADEPRQRLGTVDRRDARDAFEARARRFDLGKSGPSARRRQCGTPSPGSHGRRSTDRAPDAARRRAAA